MDDERIKRYLDDQGRVTRWPSRRFRSDQDVIVAYLATKFEPGREYTEREVNDVLKRFHTFEDWALLRRELFERGYLSRVTNGTRYWLTPKPQTT
jgi:hypothetical protein